MDISILLSMRLWYFEGIDGIASYNLSKCWTILFASIWEHASLKILRNASLSRKHILSGILALKAQICYF